MDHNNLDAPIAKWANRWRTRFFEPVIGFIAKIGITANGLTITSLFLHLLVGIFIVNAELKVAGGFLILAGVLDVFDGQLARYTNKSSDFGSFLDSILDNIGDIILNLCLAIYYIQQRDDFFIILVFLGLAGSMLTSQIRSRSGMIGIDCGKIGLMQRGERIILLIIGLLFGVINIVVPAFAILNNVSAVQRFAFVLKHQKNVK